MNAKNETHAGELSDEQILVIGKDTESGLDPWGIGSTRADYQRAARAIIAADRAQRDAATALRPHVAAWSYPIDPPEGFASYVAANYYGTVEFTDTAWHAKRLWNAAMTHHKLATARPATPALRPPAAAMDARSGEMDLHNATGQTIRLGQGFKSGLFMDGDAMSIRPPAADMGAVLSEWADDHKPATEAELATLAPGGDVAMNVVMTLKTQLEGNIPLVRQADALAALAARNAEIARLRDEDEINIDIIRRMSQILAGIAVAIKGEELPLHRHGYHDLVGLTQKNMLELELYRHTDAERCEALATLTAERDVALALKDAEIARLRNIWQVKTVNAKNQALHDQECEIERLTAEITRLKSAWQVETMHRKDGIIAAQEQKNDRLAEERDTLARRLHEQADQMVQAMLGCNQRTETAEAHVAHLTAERDAALALDRREPLPPQTPVPLTNAEFKVFKLGWLECEAAHGPTAEPMTQAARDVLAERQRQISVEGWTPEHDDGNFSGDLARAAACYALDGLPTLQPVWPWDADWWKPKDRRGNWVRAAALVLAEIERLDRADKACEGGAA
jgi:hypothetical protein